MNYPQNNNTQKAFKLTMLSTAVLSVFSLQNAAAICASTSSTHYECDEPHIQETTADNSPALWMNITNINNIDALEVLLSNQFQLTSRGNESQALKISNASKGNIAISSNANISTYGSMSDAISVAGSSTERHDISVILGKDSKIHTFNESSNAIHVYGNVAKNIEINNSGAISTQETNSNGILLTTAGGDQTKINITNSGRIDVGQTQFNNVVTTDLTRGIMATLGTHTGKGELNLTTSSDSFIRSQGRNSDGIHLQASANETNISAHILGTIEVGANEGYANFGIVSIHSGTAFGNQNIQFGENLSDRLALNNVTSTGSNAAIYATQESTLGGNISLINKGTIELTGDQNYGIRTNDNGTGLVNITNQGDIKIIGTKSIGMYTSSTKENSNITIHNTGNITHTAATSGNYGISSRLFANNGTISITNDGEITGSAYGIAAWDNGLHSGGKSIINVGSKGLVDATYAITADTSEENTISVNHGGRVIGTQTAISFRGDLGESHTSTLNNSGEITSIHDVVILATSPDKNTILTINNQNLGIINGGMKVDQSFATVNNQGTWNLQSESETASIALGAHANNTFNNTGTLNFKNKFNTISGTDTFNMNEGLLDLQSDIGAGTIVKIGQIDAFGKVTGGSFVANGGMINMDVVLGDDQSITDRIFMHNVSRGADGQTQIHINNVDGLGALTQEGIQIIDVSGTTDTDAFNLANHQTRSAPIALTNTVIAGAYEYALVQKTQSNGLAKGWYLSSNVRDITIDNGNGNVDGNTIWPPITGNPNANILIDTPIYRPDVGINLGNQQSVLSNMTPGLGNNTPIAIGAGSSSGMRALTRLSDPTNANTTHQNNLVTPQKSNSLWGFTTVNATKGKAGGRQIDYSADSAMLQIGSDASFDVGNGLIQAGIMAAYGQVKTDSTNLLTRSTGNGKVKGYSVGIYGTWYADKNSPLSAYVDTYLIHGWYNNDVTTRGNATAKYKSNATSFTLQAGLPLAINSSVIIEPQLQWTYLDYRAQDYLDHSKTKVSNTLKGNSIGRAGAYIYTNSSQSKPYAAFNVWYDNTMSTAKYNQVQVASDKKGIILEAKLGFQAKATPDLTLWGEVGIRKGKHDFQDIGASAGLKYQF